MTGEAEREARGGREGETGGAERGARGGERGLEGARG